MGWDSTVHKVCQWPLFWLFYLLFFISLYIWKGIVFYNIEKLYTIIFRIWFPWQWTIVWCNRPISQIQQFFRQMSHNAPFCNRNVHTYSHFCYKLEHCGIWDGWIVRFVQQVYCPKYQWSNPEGYGHHRPTLNHIKNINTLWLGCSPCQVG